MANPDLPEPTGATTEGPLEQPSTEPDLLSPGEIDPGEISPAEANLIETLAERSEQSEPVQDGSSDASRAQKLAGLVRQISADLELRPQEDVAQMLRIRLVETGINASEEEIDQLAKSISEQSGAEER